MTPHTADFIHSYFLAEKQESLVFVAFGLLTIGFASYALVRWGGTFYRGFAAPAILIGVIQLVVGGSVYARTDRQAADLAALHARDPGAFVAQERPRMATVMRNFAIYKVVEVACILVGVALLLLAPSRELWLGVGAAMLLQGALMLTADAFAERRGRQYVAAFPTA